MYFLHIFANFKRSTFSVRSSYAFLPPKIGQQKAPLYLCFEINTHGGDFFFF